MYINSDTIYVLNKNEVIIQTFNRDDEDTLINPEISETQNGENIFTFQVSARSEKWNNIYNPENLYLVDNKIFSANFSDSLERERSEDDEDIYTIVAYERQKLLSREYVRAWNSETGFENIDDFMVVIVSGGDLPLKNNGNLVNSKYPLGSSGYVLEGLLYGTGWTVGVCDIYEYNNGEIVIDNEGHPVYLKFDFETDQETVYDNLLKVQELWGGILIFDSVRKIVHHRDETTYLPYSGFEVKYQKNLKSSKYIGDNKIITQLCPLGEGGLNIKAINDNSLWLTNFEYTDSILKSIENNPDIYEQEQLKKWGERKLKELCKPRRELTVEIALLKNVEGYELEEIHLNDIVDVIDYDYIENKSEQLRVISYRHKIWDDSDAEVVIGDITLETTDIFKKNVSATNLINNGTLNVDRVVDYYKNGQSLAQTLRQIDQIIIETRSEFSKADDEILAKVIQTENGIDNLNNEIVAQNKTISELLISIGKISSKIDTLEGLTKTVVGENGLLIIEDAFVGDLLKLSIRAYNGFNGLVYVSEDTILANNLRLIGTENIKQEINIDINDKKVTLPLPGELRYYDEENYDEIYIENGEAILITRVGIDQNKNKYVLENPQTTRLGKAKIELVNGRNTIQIENFIPTLVAEYVYQNDYTNLFATRVELSTSIEQTNKYIKLEASKKVTTEQLVQTLNAQLLIKPDIISITGNKITIKSKYFELTADGKITATSGKIGGWLITETGLINQVGNAGLIANGSQESDVVFYAGKDNGYGGESAFRVTHNGDVFAHSLMMGMDKDSHYGAIIVKSDKEGMESRIQHDRIWTGILQASDGVAMGNVMHSPDRDKTYGDANRAGTTYWCHFTPGFAALTFTYNASHATDFNTSNFYIRSGSSDERLKNNIEEINDNLLKFASEIDLISFIFNSDPSQKIIIGAIAQKLLKLCEKYEIDEDKYDFIRKGINKSEEVPEGYYALDYEQILLLKVKVLENENKQLKEQSEKQQEQINSILNKLGI